MELRQLEYFMAICEYGNYTNAAEKLHVSQPSITVSIQNLEQELGTILLYRKKGEISLTQSGLILLDFAKKTLGEIDMVKKKICDLSKDSSKAIDLSSVPNMGIRQLTEYIEKFRKISNNINVNIHTLNGGIDVIKSLEKKEVIVGFTYIDKDVKSRFNVIPMQDLEIHILMHKNHKLKSEKHITLSMLKDEKIGMYKRGTTYCEKRIIEEFNKNGIMPNISYESEQYSAVYSMVAMGYCIGFTPDPTTNIIKNNSDIIVKSLDNEIKFQVGLVWSKSKYLPDTVKKFIEFVNDSINK